MKRTLTLIAIAVLFTCNAFPKPKISFFVELKGSEFQKLFADTALISQLVEMTASLRIGLLDFSPERTQTIVKLNQAGIPVIAWLLLPEEEGYWFHMNNGDKATQRFADFKKWTAENNLKWEGLGIDLELDFSDACLMVKHPFKLAWKAYKRLYDNHSLEQGRVIYQKLIAQIMAEGYNVESYVIPFIYDERIAKTTSLQKLLGMIDIRTPHEIPMLYTSVMGKPLIIPAYYQIGQPIALGIAGGGVVIEGMQPKFLTWEELSRDLLVSNQYSSEVAIFCLEASWANGWLTKIQSLDYTNTLPDLSLAIKEQEKSRKTLQHILVVLDHPLWMTLGVLILFAMLIFVIVKLIKFITSVLRHR
jgi:hypothetical protein